MFDIAAQAVADNDARFSTTIDQRLDVPLMVNSPVHGSGQVHVLILDQNNTATQNALADISFDRITVTGVPEPASWALMLVGVWTVGARVRCRRAVTAA